MLTYKMIDRNDKYIRYKYFPYGKDIKVAGGIIKIDLINNQYIIEELAQLDKREEFSDEEIMQMLEYINSERKKGDFPLLTKEEFIEKNLNYVFSTKLVEEIFKQIQKNNIKEKGILF
ncbi:hypothetical protein ACWOAQ_08945 [Helcococcus kunzii]|uniref:Uncharacterized protein n=1 Tax=Helcococcus kunzii ATCC 51366 TaxID=883114 RepID=H3NMD4_9FIRM|nr:hypothetical protein [Helcococcus kunzii]EHR35069.1 hypothetical protein HMPREF9709_00495 [Helcococcus kunzii ATCC 51366]QUY64450.1 hypothetical protein GUI37_02570 [Helcococcus kunzii]QZO76861.1 hypothetical protein HIF96_02250 [Helcococcus kunzii]